MHDQLEHKNHEQQQHEPKEAVGAIFGTREEARRALGALHKAHFL
jgi:hypothetical protein